MRLKLLFVLSLVFGVSVPAVVSAESSGSLRENMDRVYQAFQALQPYVFSEQEFKSKDNEEEIRSLLLSLSGSFQKVEKAKSTFSEDPGFDSTLSLLNEMLQDASIRFQSGSKGYARWRLRSAGNYCVSCHTTYNVRTTFYDSDRSPKYMTELEKAEMFLASRQVDRAEDLFVKAAESADTSFTKMAALRGWLVIQVRVKKNPHASFRKLLDIEKRVSLNLSDREEIAAWKSSFKRWMNEGKSTASPVRKAENLLRQSSGLSDLQMEASGAVELLRATAILHASLHGEAGLKGLERAKVLYFLGYAYSNLTQFFVDETPEFYLEQCILDYPGEEYAKRSFRLLKNLITRGYTGSGGTHLPLEVSEKLKLLHERAYGSMHFRGAV